MWLLIFIFNCAKIGRRLFSRTWNSMNHFFFFFFWYLLLLLVRINLEVFWQKCTLFMIIQSWLVCSWLDVGSVVLYELIHRINASFKPFDLANFCRLYSLISQHRWWLYHTLLILSNQSLTRLHFIIKWFKST